MNLAIIFGTYPMKIKTICILKKLQNFQGLPISPRVKAKFLQCSAFLSSPLAHLFLVTPSSLLFLDYIRHTSSLETWFWFSLLRSMFSVQTSMEWTISLISLRSLLHVPFSMRPALINLLKITTTAPNFTPIFPVPYSSSIFIHVLIIP